METGPIVDAHQHFWDPEANYHPWLRDEPPVAMRYGDYAAIRTTYLPPDYHAAAGDLTIVKSVYVETEWDPSDPLGETRWVQALAAEHGFPHAVVAQAWLDADDAEEVLAAQAAFPLVRSVRHKPACCHSPHAPPPWPRGSMSDARWRAGYATLAAHGLSFDLQAPWWHLPEAAALARDFPGATLIVNHTGLPPAHRSAAGLDAWRAAMAVIAAEPNAAVKISGLGQPGHRWTVEANRTVVLDTIELFGVDRCMFASNMPVDALCADIRTIYGGFARIVEHLPQQDRRKLFHDNAVRIYRL